VAAVLESAPFLWDPEFASARAALAAEHGRDDAFRPWVAGPGPSRRRLLAAARDRESVAALLAGPRARALWTGAAAGGNGAPADGGADAVAEDAAGQPITARAAAGEHQPRDAAAKLAQARALFAGGKHRRALDLLAGRRDLQARLLRAACHQATGDFPAARDAIRRLQAEDLAPAERIELAEIAVRVCANAGDRDGVRDWTARALAAGRGPLGPRARLVAAFAAWDLEDPAAMDRHLHAARGALARPELAWRWHQAAGLRALAAGDGAGAAEHLTQALRVARRRLLRAQAGGLWNDLVLARALGDDLAGAERACRHAVRLFAGCEGERRDTLALANLAEIRLRRGRPQGVRAILETVTLANRRAGNLRGTTQDAELWTRFELVHGRADAALERCRAAHVELDRHGSDFHRAELRALAARALGWLGRRAEAAAELAAGGGRTLDALEPEERPAVLAHGGDREGALVQAASTPWARLWQAALTGQPPAADAWAEVRRLERYRAARLLFDLELAGPGSVPLYWRRWAAAALRRAGAGLLAERLEGREAGPWQAVESYLLATRGDAEGAGGSATSDPIPALFVAAGYPEVGLRWSGEDGVRVLVGGPGGPEEIAAPLAGGRLTLQAPLLDATLRALFALVLGDLGRALEPGRAAPRAAAAPGGLVGESPGLRAALERLERLAPSDLPVLIRGETGTGKELAARHVHRLSRRAGAPFLAINCAALSETLLLADLFGHVRGAFTGADRDRAGVFEAARGGTVFLDEIGDLPLAAQGMLLRVLQEGEVRRLGESLPRQVDVRVLTATHRDLGRMVEDGAFRRDLYYRLKVVAVELPPLRERGDDVLRLAEHLLARSGARLSPRARGRLRAHAWPGNVRELRNVLEVAAALAAGGPIEPQHLDLPAPPRGAAAGGYHQEVDGLRRRLVAEALAACGGNRAEAARRLGLTRQALSYLVRHLDLA
jgi:DNA-binding NtrC family response regulator